MVEKPGLTVEVPGRNALRLRHLVTDFTGTLSRDGVLLDGVAERLRRLAEALDVMVATADTFGTVRQAVADLPLRIELIGNAADKAALLERLGPGGVVAMGNGRNDVAMLHTAALAIAVLGPEGAAGELLQAAHVVVRDVNDALDLLLHPLRLAATLRP